MMTAWSELDPRTKLLLVACLTSGAVIISNWAYLGLLLIVSVLLLCLFGVNPAMQLHRSRVLLYMVLGIALLQSIFAPSGEILLALGGIKLLTTGGLMRALEFVLRMLVIVTAAGILSTSSSRVLIQGLVQLKLPYEIAFMVSMGIRFLPVIAQEAQDAYTAIQLRGVDFKALSLQEKLEVGAGLLQPVLAGALLRARDMSISLEMRAFRAYPQRSSFLNLTLTSRDYAIMISTILCSIAVLFAYLSLF